MEEIAVSKFKATCLSVVEQVRKTRKPVRITRFGKPVAELIPPSPAVQPASVLGCMAGTGEILGDIISPAIDPEEWDALFG
jgi:prevent-host-death family protein